jgi:hypothetical protein
VERKFIHDVEAPCTWCGGSGLNVIYGAGACDACNSGVQIVSEVHSEPAAADRDVFAAIDLAAVEELVLEALARAAVWCGTPFGTPTRSQWWRNGKHDSPHDLPTSLSHSLQRLAAASATPRPRFETRGELLRAASELYAQLGDALDPFAPHLELLARGIALVRDGDTIELVL